MTLTPSDEFEQLLTAFERNSNMGSLKAANGTLVKILRHMWSHTAGTPEQQAEVEAVLAEVGAGTKALNEQADALLARLNDKADAYEANEANEVVSDTFVTTPPAEPEVTEVVVEENETVAEQTPVPMHVVSDQEPAEVDVASAEETAKPKRGGRPAKG